MDPRRKITAARRLVEGYVFPKAANKFFYATSNSDIVLEAAYIDPFDVHRHSRALAESTQSAARRLKHVDIRVIDRFSLTPEAVLDLRAMSELMTDHLVRSGIVKKEDIEKAIEEARIRQESSENHE